MCPTAPAPPQLTPCDSEMNHPAEPFLNSLPQNRVQDKVIFNATSFGNSWLHSNWSLTLSFGSWNALMILSDYNHFSLPAQPCTALYLSSMDRNKTQRNLFLLNTLQQHCINKPTNKLQPKKKKSREAISLTFPCISSTLIIFIASFT